MGVETRKGRHHLYDRPRVNGRLHGRDVGPRCSLTAAVRVGQAARPREEKPGAQERVLSRLSEIDATLVDVVAFDQLADQVFRAVMSRTGDAVHRRSEGRRTRGVTPMMRYDDVGTPPTRPEPTPALIRPSSRGPDHQTALDRAARGDPSALPAVRQMRNDPACLAGFGEVAGMADAGVVRLAAGDDLAVATAVRGGPPPVSSRHRLLPGPNRRHAPAFPASTTGSIHAMRYQSPAPHQNPSTAPGWWGSST